MHRDPWPAPPIQRIADATPLRGLLLFAARLQSPWHDSESRLCQAGQDIDSTSDESGAAWVDLTYPTEGSAARKATPLSIDRDIKHHQSQKNTFLRRDKGLRVATRD